MRHAVEAIAVKKTFTVGSRFPFGRRQRKRIDALKGVTLSIAEGDVYGLVGRNGYGKTTLIKCICSLLEPDSGTVSVCGYDLRESPSLARRAIGLVSADERSFYWRLTGRQNLLFFARLHGMSAGETHQRIARLAKTLEVEALIDRRFHEYSTGNRQRLAVVRALMHAPRLLVLDEPTRSLDPFAAEKLRQTLTDWVSAVPNRSVLITSHNLDEVAALSTRVGIMSRGCLAEEGTLVELRRRFDDRERIRVWFASDGELDLQAPYGASLDALLVGVDPLRGRYVEFRRRQGDDCLDWVLRSVVTAGAKITSFERQELSLQDIIDRVDTQYGET